MQCTRLSPFPLAECRVWPRETVYTRGKVIAFLTILIVVYTPYHNVYTSPMWQSKSYWPLFFSTVAVKKTLPFPLPSVWFLSLKNALYTEVLISVERVPSHLYNMINFLCATCLWYILLNSCQTTQLLSKVQVQYSVGGYINNSTSSPVKTNLKQDTFQSSVEHLSAISNQLSA